MKIIPKKKKQNKKNCLAQLSEAVFFYLRKFHSYIFFAFFIFLKTNYRLQRPIISRFSLRMTNTYVFKIKMVMESLPLIYRAKSNIYRFRFIQTEEASLKKNTHKRLHTTINNEEVHFRKKSCCRQRPEEIFFYREQRKDRRVLLRGCLIWGGAGRRGLYTVQFCFVFFIMRVSSVCV